jgi:uncharacterized membrane protein
MTGKKIPSDLVIILGLLILTDVFVLMPGLNESTIRNILGLPLVLFFPGYSLLAVLFPAKSDLDWIERTALSFGMSIAIVPLIGLGLNYSPWGIRLLPILISLSFFTFLMCGLAYLRRVRLPEIEAFEIPFRKTANLINAEILKKPESKVDKALTIFLIFSILLSVTILIIVIATPKEGEHFTEFYILGPEGKADNYTTNFVLGEKGNVIVGIVNHEYRPVNYTMEMRLENQSLPLPENLQHIALANNETWEKPVTFTPSSVGKNIKLEFLLFNETNKDIPYRDLHLWIDVNSTEAHIDSNSTEVSVGSKPRD